MGISEISTGVLVLLANFDDEFGVKGLGDAFPLTRAFLGGLFVVSFIICRTILWPTMTYIFKDDVLTAVASDSINAKQHKKWLYTFLATLTGLSFLQIIWLGQIFYMSYVEIQKLLN